MTTIFGANTVLIVIALLIGLVIGWWLFKSSRKSETRSGDEITEAHPVAKPAVTHEHPLRTTDDSRNNGLFDEGAAAMADVAGEVLGVPVHRELPGTSGPSDNLSMMKGVGPKFVTKLNEHGIVRFDQIARLSPNEVAILDEKLGAFKGRLARDRVVEQANYLARDDRDGFEAKFGKLGSE